MSWIPTVELTSVVGTYDFLALIQEFVKICVLVVKKCHYKSYFEWMRFVLRIPIAAKPSSEEQSQSTVHQ